MSSVNHLKIEMPTFLILALQLGLLLAVAMVYRIELDRGFGMLVPLIFVGFLIHSWLPLHMRVPFFLLLTIAGIILLFRWNSFALILLGAGLLSICHLRVSWWGRVGLLLTVGVGLAVLQAGVVTTPWAAAVLPILGAMFMFRIILYLHDLKHEQTASSIWQRLAYFFMLPNICFPLFPVIDYKAFIKNYYNEEASQIYQNGIYWITIGLSHLLIYRLVYYLLPRANYSVDGLLGFYLYSSGVFALYLRVSGLFHLIIGILMLFGFNLPRTNNRYFLASSFTDLWRRINIYWKDFMMNTVFYPVFMSTRRWGMNFRLVFAVASVFFITWALHSYQWFWLQGSFPIRATDIVFWGALGTLLAVNTVLEASRGRARLADEMKWALGSAVARAAKVLAVFSSMALLWTLWNSESLAEWGYRVADVRNGSLSNHALFAVLIVGLLGVGALIQAPLLRRIVARAGDPAVVRKPTVVLASCIALLLLGHPILQTRFEGTVGRVVEKAQATELNAIDMERDERGYYEALSRAGNIASTIGRSPERPDEWVAIYDSPATYKTGDLRGWALVPKRRTSFKGAWLTTNEWGLRDREYEIEKREGVYRIALVGFSHEMGAGVSDDETFENVLEDQLNTRLPREGLVRFEILNFSVGGYGRLQALYTAERLVPRFKPDMVLYVVHPGESGRMINRLGTVVELGLKLEGEYSYLARVLRASEAGSELPPGEFTRRLHPKRSEMLEWAFVRQVEAAKKQGAIPMFIFLEIPSKKFSDDEIDDLVGLVRRSGGEALFLTDVYDGHELDEIRIAPWDDHPNALGHRLIANRLYREMLQRHNEFSLLDIGTGKTRSGHSIGAESIPDR